MVGRWGHLTMLKLVGKVILRNAYRVVLDLEGDYKVTHKDARGAEYSQDVAAKVVRYVQRECRGKTVSVAEAKNVLEDAPRELPVPYEYGQKLQYYAQSVLIVLVATRQASYAKVGQRYDYTIRAPKNTPAARREKSGHPAVRAKQPR